MKLYTFSVNESETSEDNFREKLRYAQKCENQLCLMFDAKKTE